MLSEFNKLFVFKSLLTTPSNVLPSHHKQTFLAIISVFTEGEGDGIKSRLPFKTFSTLLVFTLKQSHTAYLDQNNFSIQGLEISILVVLDSFNFQVKSKMCNLIEVILIRYAV